MAKRDRLTAASAATALLKELSKFGISSTEGQSLFADLSLAVQLVGESTCDNFDAIKSTEEQIDWYEPSQAKKFYVLDSRSGAALRDVLDDLRNTRRYLNRGARAPNRLLFIGRPGTGKTAGALWLGGELGVPVALIRIDGVVSSSAGKTSKNLRAAFELASTRPCIIVIDEFEAFAVSRADQSPNTPQWTKEVTSALLQLLNSLPEDQTVIGCTNVPEVIDRAVVRRLRKHVHFHPPDRSARAAMLAEWWRRANHEGSAKRRLLDLTEGHTGDFLERIAEEANRAAARRSEVEKITVEDVDRAIESATEDDEPGAARTERPERTEPEAEKKAAVAAEKHEKEERT